jgi:hypothetical protein
MLDPPLRSRSPHVLTCALAVLCLVAAACGGSSGADGGAGSTSADDQLCARQGLSETFTGGSRARSVVLTPKRTKLLGIGLGKGYLVWTQESGSGTGLVCQQRIANGQVTALARGDLRQMGIVTTDEAVYFVADGDRGPSLFKVDHRGRRSREIATGITANISGSGRYVAYADEPALDVERVTVLDSSRDDATVDRYRFGACDSQGENCAPVTSVSMVPNGLAWMRLQDDGSGAVLAVRPLNGVGITRPVSAVGAKLYPSDLFPVFDDVRQDRHVYAAWLISSGARQSLGTFGSDQLLAVAGGAALTLHAPGASPIVRAVSVPSARQVDMDDLGALGPPKGYPVLAGVAVNGRRFCELVNVFAGEQPSQSEMPLESFVRCGHLPAV